MSKSKNSNLVLSTQLPRISLFTKKEGKRERKKLRRNLHIDDEQRRLRRHGHQDRPGPWFPPPNQIAKLCLLLWCQSAVQIAAAALDWSLQITSNTTVGTLFFKNYLRGCGLGKQRSWVWEGQIARRGGVLTNWKREVAMLTKQMQMVLTNSSGVLA